MSAAEQQGASGRFASFAGARLTVRVTYASQQGERWNCYRAGFEFGKEAVDIEMDQLGETLAEALETIISIVTETTQRVRVVLTMRDGSERILNEGENGPPVEAELAVLRAELAAAQNASNGAAGS